MLSCPPQSQLYSSLCSLVLQPLGNSNFTIAAVLNHQNSQTPDTRKVVLRKHNSKSTSFLLHQLSHQHDERNPQKPNPIPNDLQDTLPEEEKIKLLELSLVRKRTPQFPGSIYVQSPSDPDVGSSLPPLRTLFQEGHSEDDEHQMIMRAIEIRRTVTQEIFKEAMQQGKFGITYATNLVSKMPDFIDYVMIEAASMKRLPEFSESTFNLRAKTVIDDSKVVQLIRWLKHNSLSYPQIAKLICMSKGELESILRLAEWLKTIGVKGRFLGVALVKSGEKILERSKDELDEVVQYLVDNGIRREWMGYVLSRCPQLLSYSLEEVKSRVEFYLDMDMNEKDFGTMVFDYPRVLGYFTVEEMKQKVDYLKEFGLRIEDVGRLLAFKPQLMGCSIEERWKPLVKYLYYHGITRDGMRRMLTIKPMVFCVDLETTIVPKVRFFQDLGIRDDAIGNMLVKFPTLLTYSLHKKIRPLVIFLMTKAGVSERDIGKVIALGPELLGCSIVHKLEVNVKYFLSLGIRLRQLGEMISDFPMLLRYNINVLRPKYSYLRRTMVRPLQDLIEFPRFFSYSLDGRIIPRHKVLVECRINFKLRYMLAITDEEFKKMVEATVKKRWRFESSVINDEIPMT
ncbi:Transcription termination factor family protein [Quillaja saponaria]|uniref:Transcription termination factor family protein n=1 Tax=Quillaja saponaria TaxID=32244 RepID=A0AAD7QBJ9_QUISA|nr:Transcription termination factor family protein [Quillaja saponaria]